MKVIKQTIGSVNKANIGEMFELDNGIIVKVLTISNKYIYTDNGVFTKNAFDTQAREAKKKLRLNEELSKWVEIADNYSKSNKIGHSPKKECIPRAAHSNKIYYKQL
jgi:hypothetical protein